MTPFDDFAYLVNSVLLGEHPTVEDFILLIGTAVAFIAFVLWCCFPIHPKEVGHQSFSCKSIQHSFAAANSSYTKSNYHNNLIHSGATSNRENNHYCSS